DRAAVRHLQLHGGKLLAGDERDGNAWLARTSSPVRSADVGALCRGNRIVSGGQRSENEFPFVIGNRRAAQAVVAVDRDSGTAERMIGGILDDLSAEQGR